MKVSYATQVKFALSKRAPFGRKFLTNVTRTDIAGNPIGVLLHIR